MALSPDPEKRRIQLANLKVGPVTHGASSESELRPLRERFVEEYLERFPSADPAEVSLLSHRRAQLELLQSWQDRYGLFSNKQRGTVTPASELFERTAIAFERQLAGLRERESDQPLEPVRFEDALESLRAGRLG